MFSDDGLIERKASKAIEMAERYDWNVLHAKMEDVYTKVASGDYTEKDARS